MTENNKQRVFMRLSVIASTILMFSAPQVVFAAEPTPTPDNSFSNLFSGGDSVPDIPDNATTSLFTNDDSTTMDSVTNGSYGMIRQIIPIVIALCLIWLVTSFVIFAVQLSRYGDNPSERQKIYQGFKRNLIAVAIVGGASVIAGMFVGIGKSAF